MGQLVEQAYQRRKDAVGGSAMPGALRPTLYEYERLCDLVIAMAKRIESLEKVESAAFGTRKNR